MIKYNKRITKLRDITEQQKDKILKHIIVSGISIKSASLELGLTVALINKIFTERFGKRERKIQKIKEIIKLNLNQ